MIQIQINNNKELISFLNDNKENILFTEAFSIAKLCLPNAFLLPICFDNNYNNIDFLIEQIRNTNKPFNLKLYFNTDANTN